MRIFIISLLFLLLGGLGSVLAQDTVLNDSSAINPEPAPAVSAIAEDSQAAEDFVANDDFFGVDDDEDFTDGDLESFDINDPIEPFNRGMFWFNDKLYFYLLKPIARGYRVVPEPARQSVANFFSNLGTPVRFVSSVLQLKFTDAGTELGRLVVNSTVGIAGLFDPAKKYLGWRKKDEDLGQTFGNYGVGSGFYIVWPLLGPSSVRDTVGMVGDYFLDPLHYAGMKPMERVALKGLEMETKLSLDKDTYEGIKRQALDPYLYIRTTYAQHREGKIKK
ncbi:VacJ family lipoprotein [Syntrophotalea acetylenivorans]|uniref:MlaA family lipoprotein n=1 Tax=Syntrophotalea acetylenivorans TaxID=1842532 RepID=UPI000AA085E4|nr:VacJ family lipoprotein [Syntrophotalea acetylenivorans]